MGIPDQLEPKLLGDNGIGGQSRFLGTIGVDPGPQFDAVSTQTRYAVQNAWFGMVFGASKSRSRLGSGTRVARYGVETWILGARSTPKGPN